MELSLEKQAIIEAFNRGYEITESGLVYSHKGVLLSQFKNKKGYLEFAYRMLNGHKKNIKVHKYQAYAKYTDIFLISEAVNHKDGDKENNHIDNIQITTFKEANNRSVATNRRNRR